MSSVGSEGGGTATCGRDFREQRYFHGLLARKDAEALLKTDGDFLVRETSGVMGKKAKEGGGEAENATVVSVRWAGDCKHLVIRETDDGFYVNKHVLPDVHTLINFHVHKKMPVENRRGVLLTRLVPKQSWELERKNVITKQFLGEGAFGQVYKGTLLMAGGRRTVPVTIKQSRQTLHVTSDRALLLEMMAEARFMRGLRHPNVVRLHGIVADREPVLIVLEYVDGGSLDVHLRRRSRRITEIQRLRYCRDAAAGLAYLHGNQRVHRDVAARNCLISKGNGCVKIADFGLSRQLDPAEGVALVQKGAGERVPFKWMAPESMLLGVTSTESDAYMYGMLVWEAFNNADAPYAGWTPNKVRDKVAKQGERPRKGPMPEAVARLVDRLWDADPKKRPKMSDVIQALDLIIVSSNSSLSVTETDRP